MQLFYSRHSKVVIDVLNSNTGRGYIHEESLEKINKLNNFACELLTIDEVIQDLKKTYKLYQLSKKQLGEYLIRHFNAIHIGGFYFNYEYNHAMKTNEIVISFNNEHYYIACAPEYNL